MNLGMQDKKSPFHIHELKTTNRHFSYCDVCNKIIKEDNHFYCQQCDFDICYECLKKGDEMVLSSSEVLKRLLISTLDISKSMDMINFIQQRSDIFFTSPSLENSIIRSYPTFYLFEEQDRNETHILEATRFYVDKNGQNVYFFSSSKSRKAIQICKKCCDEYFENHSFSLKLSQYYPKLRALKEQNYQFSTVDSVARQYSASFFFGATFGIAYGIEKMSFAPKMFNAISGYLLFQHMIKASDTRCGVETTLKNDFHITPTTNFNPVNYSVPDHNITIDWSKITSIPIIISLTNEIKKLYQNILNENDQIALNILFSLADDLQEGISLMKQNPLFSKQEEKRLISFADSSIKSLQIFLRLKSEPFTILNTTILNVYQADLGREFHAFLSSDQLPIILSHLVNDIRENLTSFSQFGEVIELDVNDPKPVFIILNSYITENEVKLAIFIKEICDKIVDCCRIIKNAFASLVLSHFDSIKKFVFAGKEIQLKNLKLISEFNQSHQSHLANFLIDFIKKKIIPDFYSIELSKKINEIAHLKHLVQLVRLTCEIERRIKDNIGIFNIDLAIIKSQESIYKYNIHIII